MKRLHAIMAGIVVLMSFSVPAVSAVKAFHPEETTIADVQAAYKSGAITATQLVQAYLERIQAYDQKGPKLNVVISLNPKTMQEAAALDEHFRATGKFVGPLHGIPVLLKDNINTSDMPTTAGSLTLAGFTPPTDATVTESFEPRGQSSWRRSTCTSSQSGVRRSARSVDRLSIPTTLPAHRVARVAGRVQASRPIAQLRASALTPATPSAHRPRPTASWESVQHLVSSADPE